MIKKSIALAGAWTLILFLAIMGGTYRLLGISPEWASDQNKTKTIPEPISSKELSRKLEAELAEGIVDIAYSIKDMENSEEDITFYKFALDKDANKNEMTNRYQEFQIRKYTDVLMYFNTIVSGQRAKIENLSDEHFLMWVSMIHQATSTVSNAIILNSAKLLKEYENAQTVKKEPAIEANDISQEESAISPFFWAPTIEDA